MWPLFALSAKPHLHRKHDHVVGGDEHIKAFTPTITAKPLTLTQTKSNLNLTSMSLPSVLF